MKILIVGGTGMIGAHTALHLRDQGNDVTVAARNPLADDSRCVISRCCSATTRSRRSRSTIWRRSRPSCSLRARTSGTWAATWTRPSSGRRPRPVACRASLRSRRRPGSRVSSGRQLLPPPAAGVRGDDAVRGRAQGGGRGCARPGRR
ncbi:NAD-dependent epimerase/dehydratase family protein, partial [Rhodococcus hoagii]|nr:NAD-dependent epimerase/dehydratase family protein [Prescottella equi]